MDVNYNPKKTHTWTTKDGMLDETYESSVSYRLTKRGKWGEWETPAKLVSRKINPQRAAEAALKR